MRSVFIFSLLTAIQIMRVHGDSDECNHTKIKGICNDSSYMDLRAQTVSCLFKNTSKFSMHFLVDTDIHSIKPGYEITFKTNVLNLIDKLLDKVKKYGNALKFLSAYTFSGANQFKTVDNRTISDGADVDSFRNKLSAIDDFTLNNDQSPGNKLSSALQKVTEEFRKMGETQQTKILWVFSDARSDEHEHITYVTNIQMRGNSLKSDFNTTIFTVSMGECPFGFFDQVEYQYAMRNLSTLPGYSACYSNWLETFVNYLDKSNPSCPDLSAPPPPPPPPVVPIVCTIAGVLFLIILIFVIYKLKRFCKPKPPKPPPPIPPPKPGSSLNNDTSTTPYINPSGTSPITISVDDEEAEMFTGPGSSSSNFDENSIVFQYIPGLNWESYLKKKKSELSLSYIAISSIKENFSAKTDEGFSLEKNDVIKVKELFEKSKKTKKGTAPLELCNYKFNCRETKPGVLKGMGFKELDLEHYNKPVTLVLSCDGKYVVAALFNDTSDATMTSRIENEIKKILNDLNK